MDDVMKMTEIDLAQCAENVRVGWGLMLAAEGQIVQGYAQWCEGALKAAEGIVIARDALKNDAAFGKWCSDNGLSLKVIDKDNRAALIRVGRNLPYWRARLAEGGTQQSLRYAIKDVPDEVSLAAIPTRHQTKPGPKTSTAKPAPAKLGVAQPELVEELEPEPDDDVDGEQDERQPVAKEPNPPYVPDGPDFDGYDPYDHGEGSVENLWQTVLRAGLNVNRRDTKFFIHNRAKAVAWFEDMLAEYDAKKH
jgi:hypothetical protein